uniref:Ubiquitin-like protease family profile domain-containing protein n=1 Tax=viral metagenome TaxID=1070528 RepID=A0A6C0B818_9ZZZZ
MPRKTYRPKKKNRRTKRIIKGGKSNKFKSMNCHPIVKGKSPIKGSCFTVETLMKIKSAYNKHHPTEQITINDPHLLWLELKKRFATCSQEDCWLEKIHDNDLKEQIDKMSFAPDHPEEWKKNPDEWLSNYDILEVLEQYEKTHDNFKFIGPTPMDFDSRPHKKDGKCVWEEMCGFSLDKLNPKIKKIGIVFNLDDHDEPGSHWVSLFIDLEDAFMFYFDSAGDDVTVEVKKFMDRVKDQWSKKYPLANMKIYKNHPFEHQKQNTECGMYSLFFIITLLTHQIEGKHYKTEQLIHKFLSERIPDKYVFDYRKVYFNSN